MKGSEIMSENMQPLEKVNDQLASLEGSSSGDAKTLKAGSISLSSLIVLAISAAAPAMCISGSIGYIMGGSGLAVPLAFLIATIVVVLISVSYAQLSERYNSAGGTYSYVREVLGGKAGWWTGWQYIGMTFMAGCGGSIFAIYLNSMFPQVPLWLGVLIIVIATSLVGWFGIQLSTKAVIALWVVQMILFIVPAIITLRSQALVMPEFSGQIARAWTPGLGIKGLFMGVLFCIWSYVGFEVPAYMGEEVKGGSKSIKKAIPIGAIAIGITYIIASWLWVTSISQANLAAVTNSGTALIDLLGILSSPTSQMLVIAAVAIACVACWFSFITAMLRMFYDMGRSKALPKAFATLNKHSSPKFACYVISVLWFLMALFGAYISVDVLVALFASFACVAYICVSISNMKDRWHSKGVKAVFANKIIPVITIAILLIMICSQSKLYIGLLAGWGVIGLIIIQVISAVKGKDYFKKMKI